MNVPTDDWEPAIAADPNAPFVYMLTTRYAPKPCPGNCPSPWMALEISSDGGATWSNGVPLCACKGSGQFDPIIEVVPNTGHVYAIYMNGYNVVFTKSTNHGQTWSTPVKTYGQVSWNDKPVLAMSNDGQHVYVSWNGPNAGDPWVAQSHDAGATWTQTKLVDGPRYFFAYDADVLPNGTVVFSQSSILYGGQGSTPSGQVQHHAFVSSNQGASWQNVVVDSVEIGESCVAAGCSSDFYIGHSGVSADASGQPRDGLRRCHDAGRQAADLLEAIDERRARRGRRARRSRRRASNPPLPSSSPEAPVTCACGSRRRTAGTTTPGTSGTGAPPTEG